MPDRPSFSKIREAREALKERAVEIMEMYINNAKLAQAEGNFEVAQKSLEWIMLHTPKDADGISIVERDIDKQQVAVDSGSRGPQINIGFALGGLKQKELPATVEVVEVKPDEVKK